MRLNPQSAMRELQNRFRRSNLELRGGPRPQMAAHSTPDALVRRRAALPNGRRVQTTTGSVPNS
eukprot:743201-Alexandrium_andersonii.AAC.1